MIQFRNTSRLQTHRPRDEEDRHRRSLHKNISGAQCPVARHTLQLVDDGAEARVSEVNHGVRDCGGLLDPCRLCGCAGGRRQLGSR